MSENRNTTNKPSRRQIALQLAAGLASNPKIVESSGIDSAAIRALEILNALEKRLNLPPTRARQAGTSDD